MTDSVTRGTDSSQHDFVVRPDDPGYDALATRGKNKRFSARPEVFHVVRDTADVVRAVRDAVLAGKRIAVRSGGHSYENLVGDPAVQVVIDLGGLDTVTFDERRRAFAVGAGARLEDVYRELYEGWGVTIPAGNSSDVGIGGHVQGGGYGSLCRRHGITVDHLYAVEVVVVDSDGEPRPVVATREPTDPNQDLWWAHTGGGGGNFGVVTRFWFRSPDATGEDPRTALPRPPAEQLVGTILFPREGFDRSSLHRLTGNYATWLEQHSAVGSPDADLFTGLVLVGTQAVDDQGMAAIAFAHMDASVPEAERLLREHLAALAEDVGGSPVFLPVETMPWLASKKALADAQDGPVGRQKVKSSHHRSNFTAAQLDTMWEYLTDTDNQHESALVTFESFGGRAGTVAQDATAFPQRDSLIRVLFVSTWQDPATDDACLGWMRRFFRDVYARTGGVPVPDGENSDGCFINFADVDMADPKWNTSGVPWHHLFYKGNYPRLQAIKAAWDPRGVFSHPLSIRPVQP